MESAVLQLIIAPPEGQENPALARRSLLEVTELPSEVGGDGHPLPDRKTPTLFRLEPGGRIANVVPLPDIPLLLNGSPCVKSTPLALGDELCAHGVSMRAFVRYEHTPLSWQSQLLARLSKCLVVIFILLEAWVMLGLPKLVSTSENLNSSLTRQRIYHQLDQLRNRLRELKPQNQLEQAIASELNEDLEHRVRYLRKNEANMRKRQRRKMQDSLRQITAIMELLENDNRNTRLLAPPDIDGAIQKILQEQP
ncbi:MAG: hypothetical protein IJJ33_11490 [Victivallales bacterium]|nr:hypothetical protein [Victivallales bacterium]